MSEEVQKVKYTVSYIIFWSINLNDILIYIMIIVILSAMSPLDKILTSVFSVIMILLCITDSVRIITAIIYGLFVINLFINVASIASFLHLIWIWTHDGSLPQWFVYINTKHLVLIHTIWLTIILIMLLSLLNLKLITAFSTIIILSSFVLYCFYTTVISSMLYTHWMSVHSDEPLKLSVWNLSRYGVYINCFAVIYTIYCIIWLPVPLSLPVTAINMNYAGPIFLFVFFFAIILWFVRAQKHWKESNVAIINFIKTRIECAEDWMKIFAEVTFCKHIIVIKGWTNDDMTAWQQWLFQLNTLNSAILVR